MIELFHFALAPATLIPTILLIFILIYWITVFTGLLGTDFLDFDVPEIHTTADLIAEAPEPFAVGWLNQMLAFFNLRQLPVMVFLSFVVLPFWFFAVFINYHLGIESFFLSFVLLIPNFIFSLFVAKFLSLPFIKVFGKLNTEISGSEGIIGHFGNVRLTIRPGKVGQVEIIHKNTPILVIAHSEIEEDIPTGAQILVIDYNEKDYLVEPYKN